MIYLNSRYADADIAYVLDPRSQTTRATVFRTLPDTRDQYRLYKWRSGDRLDLIADSYYDDPGEWWRIIDANPEIVDPAAIAPGQSLRIP